MYEMPAQDKKLPVDFLTEEALIEHLMIDGLDLGPDPSARIKYYLENGLIPPPTQGRFPPWTVKRIISIEQSFKEGKSLEQIKKEISRERRKFLSNPSDLTSLVNIFNKISASNAFFLFSLLLLFVVGFGVFGPNVAPNNPVVVAGQSILKTAASPVGKTLVVLIKTAKPEEPSKADPLGLTNLEASKTVIPDNIVQLTDGNLILPSASITAESFSGSGKDLTDLPAEEIKGELNFATLPWSSVTNKPTVLSARNISESSDGVTEIITGSGLSLSYNLAADTLTLANSDSGSSQFIFKNIAVSGQPTIVADTNDDILTVAAGANVALTTDPAADTLTIGVTGTVANADTLDGLDSTAFAQKALNEVVLGAWTFGSTSTTPLLVKPSGAFGGTHFDVQNSTGVSLFNVDTLGSVRFPGHLYSGGVIRLGNDGTLYNINAITASGAVTLSGTVTINNSVNIGESLGVAHNLTLNKINIANSLPLFQTRNSNRLVLQGAYWNGSSSTDINMQILNIVTSTAPNYRISFLDNGSTERAYIDNSGNAMFAGGNISTTASQLILSAATGNQDVVVQGGLCIRNATACPDVPAGGLVVDTAGGTADDPGDVFDIAEIYDSSEPLEQGDVVTTAGERKIKKSDHSYDQGAIGIVSSHPAATINEGSFSVGVNQSSFNPNKPWVALAGRVPTKVSTENGAIVPGDPLTSSSIPGVAMKATKSGPIIGKALESYSGSEIGKITVFVSTSWYVASLESSDQTTKTSVTSMNIQNLAASSITTQILVIGNTKISLNKEGHLKLDGNVEINGNLLAKQLTANKINIQSKDPNSSIGRSKIVAGQTEVVILSTQVTSDSLIFVTPTNLTDKILSVVEKKAGESFVVKIKTSSDEDIEFNWWIVN